jgi:hypothetical protein
MRFSFPVFGSLAVVLLLVYLAGISPLLPHTTAVSIICLLAVGSSLVTSVCAVWSPSLYDRVLGKVVLAVIAVLVLAGLFLPTLSST